MHVVGGCKMARKCAFCGQELQEGDVYCGSCGNLAAGEVPPANAWSRVSADLAAAPKKKKRGCLTALLIFIIIIVLLAAALYIFVLRPIGKLKDGFDLDLNAPGFSETVESARSGRA